MIKFLRIIFFLPAFIAGVAISAIVSAVFNAPLFLIEYINEHIGNWSLGALLFGQEFSLAEITYVFFSGLFMCLLGLLFSISVFPYEKHRNKLAYVLFVWVLLIGFNTTWLSSNGSYLMYVSRILGNILGIIVVIKVLRNPKGKEVFAYIDKRFPASF